MRLNHKIRQLWAEKILELTNIGAGALIFGQFVSDQGFSPYLILIGIGLVLFGFIASFVFLSKK